jgi:hypothetical protein
MVERINIGRLAELYRAGRLSFAGWLWVGNVSRGGFANLVITPDKIAVSCRRQAATFSVSDFRGFRRRVFAIGEALFGGILKDS